MNGAENARAAPHVLLVEDEPGIRDSLAMILELEGYEVSCAYDGREALWHLEQRRPDVVITDYMMPRLDGLAMVKAIRDGKRHAAVPIVLMSAADIPDPERSLEAVDAFMRKPLQIEELLNTIARLVAPDRA